MFCYNIVLMRDCALVCVIYSIQYAFTFCIQLHRCLNCLCYIDCQCYLSDGNSCNSSSLQCPHRLLMNVNYKYKHRLQVLQVEQRMITMQRTRDISLHVKTWYICAYRNYCYSNWSTTASNDNQFARVFIQFNSGALLSAYYLKFLFPFNRGTYTQFAC